VTVTVAQDQLAGDRAAVEGLRWPFANGKAASMDHIYPERVCRLDASIQPLSPSLSLRFHPIGLPAYVSLPSSFHDRTNLQLDSTLNCTIDLLLAS